MVSTTRILGYSNHISVAPGESLDFKISCDGVTKYHADIVRLICADPDPSGPGLLYDTLVTDATGWHAGRHQPVHAGSYVAVPPLDCPKSFSIGAMIFPTAPGGKAQTLLGQWDKTTGTGYALGLDADGALSVTIGDGQQPPRAVTTKTPLPARQWAFVAAGVDTRTGDVWVHQRILRPLALAPVESTIRERISIGRPETSEIPLMMAAHVAAHDGDNVIAGGHYNGKIDRPHLVGRTCDPASMQKIVETGTADALDPDVIGWDFSQDMTGTIVREISGNGQNGTTVNLPARAVTGHNWDGSVLDWRLAPEQYGAIHFHDDDLYDCGWETDFSWTVPEGTRSGFYATRLTTDDDESWVSFFVRPKQGRSTAPVAFVASTATFMAYANTHHRMDCDHIEHLYEGLLTFGETEVFLGEHRELGGSHYDTHSDGSGVFYSSRLRPILNMRPGLYTFNFINDSYVCAWLESLNQAYDVITDEDIEAEGVALLNQYTAVITGSHPEYISVSMWDALDQYQQAGGRHMYLGGNGFYWRIAYHPELPGVIENRRGHAGVRTWEGEPGEDHLSFTGESGGLWRTQGRAPQTLVGVGFSSCLFDKCTYYERTDQSHDPRVAFIFEGIADSARIGDFGQRGGGAAGLEMDRLDYALGTPPHALAVATSKDVGPGGVISVEEFITTPPVVDGEQLGMVRADIVFFETPNGGAVWSTGSIAWPTSLSHNGFDNNVARMTANVLRRFLDPTPFTKEG
jgi:N,N-dimethylformamidase